MWHLSLLALAAPKADEVVSLPGWKGELPSKIFSGYIDVSAAMGNAMQVCSAPALGLRACSGKRRATRVRAMPQRLRPTRTRPTARRPVFVSIGIKPSPGTPPHARGVRSAIPPCTFRPLRTFVERDIAQYGNAQCHRRCTICTSSRSPQADPLRIPPSCGRTADRAPHLCSASSWSSVRAAGLGRTGALARACSLRLT